MKYALLIIAVLVLPGCAYILEQKNVEKAVVQVQGQVDKLYCPYGSEIDRHALRDKFNPTPGGAMVFVYCPGDSDYPSVVN